MLQNTDSQPSLVNKISRLSQPFISPDLINVNVNGTLYFTDSDETNGTELWKIDTEGNPVQLDINLGEGSSNPYNLTNVNGTLYFTSDNGTNGTELWKIDTEGNPVQLDINLGEGSSNPYNLTNVNGTLYFTSDNGTNGTELWKIDTEGNPVQLDINLGEGSSNPYNLTNVNGTLYFTSDNGTNGTELWKIDTEGNPVQLDINLGEGSSGDGNDYLFGLGGNDILNGGNGNDYLNGGTGDDVLIGGVGVDRLTGGTGSDRFILANTQAGDFDIITDFTVGDTVLISKLEFGLNQELGALDSSVFRLGSSAILGSDRFIYDQIHGKLFFDADGVGTTAQVQIALFSNQASLASTDIIVTEASI
ncbi:DUF5050 domain-containing protein [Trichormus sp. NMC-1]|uniref:DUF5050 domain-containing protein n=1 Tax=Trichormus sp. NMC-1 TaxID=1853259 RepID=UPI0008DC11A9|nr:DUF5050 domain-containing protein [Trichormus sp. NMC-1]